MNLPDTPRENSRWRSLHAKVWIGTLALVAYLAGAAMYVANERASIDSSFRQLETVSGHEKALALTEAAVNGALLDVSAQGPEQGGSREVPLEVHLYMENCGKLFANLDPFDPGYARLQRAIERSYRALLTDTSRASWLDLRESLARVSADLEIRHRTLSEQKDVLGATYRRHYDAVTVETLGLAIVGLVAFGSLAAWFVSGIARDVRRLEAHAWRVVRGVRGTQLQVDRRDELGELMRAVNRMALDLDEREQQIALDAERRSHEDKMLAVAAVAAGVAHEVNNPLAVIAGLAQELEATPPAQEPPRLSESARQILAQVDRAARASRQLADVAAPQPEELGWVDLNSLVRRAVQLMGYDRRYRATRIVLALDDGLPALHTSASALQLVLMQVLATGCEAAARRRGADDEVRLATRTVDGRVRVEMDAPAAPAGSSDADPEAPAVASLPMLVRATLDALGGRLALEQADGGRWRVQFTLPVDVAEAS